MSTQTGLKTTTAIGLDVIRGASLTVSKAFNDAQKKLSKKYLKVFGHDTIDGVTAKYARFSGNSALPDHVEGNPTAELEMYRDANVDITPVDKKGKITISDKLLKFGAFKNTALNQSLRLARALDKAKSDTCLAVLAGAFSSSKSVTFVGKTYKIFGLEGKAMLSTHHTDVHGNTFSNVSATGDVLSTEALEEGKAVIASNPTYDGDPSEYGENGYILVVAGKNKGLAERIVGSTKLQGTPNNDMNNHTDIEVVAFAKLDKATNPNAWYLISKDEIENPLLFADNEYEGFKDYHDDDNDAYVAKVWTSVIAGFTSPNGIYGSKGDGQAYSG